MRQSHHFLFHFRSWVLLPLVFFTLTTVVTASSLIYKNYVIRYDRGWDILCEPYVVRQGDWVLKIFRQKGEIAHQDFRDFLGIFQRLNPHIKDVNMVRPGQGIDIPLRKLEHGTLSGQASGVVTIPFVTLTQVKEVIKEHSETYRVQRGDTVSKLIAKKYGAYGSKAYQEGVKLFQAANPHVTNLDIIYAGQKVYLPDPSIRQETFYEAMYDEQGNLRQTLARGPVTSPTPTGPEATSDAAPISASDDEIKKEENTPYDTLKAAAAAVGGQLRSKGTFFLPRSNTDDFEIDLSQNPMMDFADGAKVAFTQDDRIMEMDARQFNETWPQIKTVSLDDQSSVEEIIASILEALKENGDERFETTFENNGLNVTVRSRWVRPDSDGRHLCITPINSPDEQTPTSILRFLEQNGIVLKEILPGGSTAELDQGSKRHAIKNVLALAPSGQRDFVKALSRALGFSYTANTSITFPYAGIQVEAYADLVSAGNSHETLVDFGNLYGDAVEAITKTGLNLVQISTREGYDAITQKLLTALSMTFEIQPTFLAAHRPIEYNTIITVPGFLYAKSDSKRILLTGAALPSAVTDLLSSKGIDVIGW